METLLSTKAQSWLIWFLRGFLILGFLILFGRLFELQVIRGGYFRGLSEENRIRRVPIVAPRGRIFARGGEVVVDNKEVTKRVVFEPESGFQKQDADKDTSDEELITEWERRYVIGSDFSHVSGYLGEISEEELGKVEAECPEKGPRRLGDFIGRGGLEEKYDCLLRGIDGEELVEVDAYGNKVRVLGRRNPVPGSDIHTTIDYGLQKKVSELMKDVKGAVVITDARSEVLALYSSPSFDSNIFVEKERSGEIKDVLADKNLPLFNRVIGGMYHPGSVFKPVVVIAALEEEAIDENYTFEDNGFISITSQYGNFTFNNWYYTQYGGREGKIGIERAIARSTDTFFYKIGELTGVEKISEWAHKFNLDEATGIDIPGEVSGLVPDPVWKVKTKGERWFLGNTYHLSIGQGDIALTPLGLNSAISAIANNGEYCQPHFMSYDDSKDNECTDLEIKKENIDLVKRGMVGACSPGGTGYTFFDFKEKSNVEAGCKTGTAEVGDVTDETHAWFTVFAPLENPEIVATVLVERGGEGSRVAGPIARDIFNHWFKVPETPVATPSATPANERQ